MLDMSVQSKHLTYQVYGTLRGWDR